MPKVSVVMPVYNGEKYLREAIDSIINQTFTDWEFIIVNEYGSSQAATDILAEYAAMDPRIRVIQNKERLRIAESLNVGFRAAKGEYIARMDGDDISSPERLQKQVDYLDKHLDIDICGLKVTMFGEGVWDWRVYYGADYLRCAALFYTPFVHPTVMLRKLSLIENHLEYDPQFYYSEDFDFFVRAAKHLKFDNLPDKDLYRYRFFSDNATNVGGSQGIAFNKNVLRRTMAEYGLNFLDEEITLLLPNSFPKSKTADEFLNNLEKLDLLLKKVFLQKKVQTEYGIDVLFQVLHRVWLDAFEKNRWQAWAEADDRVSLAIKRGLFNREHFYKVAGYTGNAIPRVSILLPTFNSEEYILDTVYSLLKQDYPNFEILVVNEYGSDDRTVECLQMFNDPRIRILQNNKKMGLAESLNRGLREAVGEYVARADADDVYPEERLSKQVAFMDENPDVAICGSWQRHFGKRNLVHMPPSTPEEMQASLLFKCEVCHSTIMLRREVFKQFNLWYDSAYLSEDYELWTRAVEHIKFATIPEILGEYRWNGENITEKKMSQLDLEAQRIVACSLKKYLNMDIPDNDLILLSGWQNPFCDGFYDQKALRQGEEKLLKQIEEQNKRVHFYDDEALANVLRQRREWAGMLKTEVISATEPAQSKLGFKQRVKRAIKNSLKKFYKPFKWRYEDRIAENLETSWQIMGKVDYLQQTLQNMDGHLWDYFNFLQQENQRQQRQIEHLQAVVNAKQLQIERLMAEQENSVKMMLEHTVVDVDQHMNRRLEQVEKSINQTTDTRIWQAEKNINQTTDTRIWQAEKGINEKTDARIWQAEQNINQLTDGRIWKAEQNIVQKQENEKEKFLDETHRHIDFTYRDIMVALQQQRAFLPANDIRLETDHPIAYESLDHLYPHGTIRDNTRYPRFVEKCEELLLPKRDLAFLDLGCSGGGMVLESALRGHLSMGLEGSDCSKKEQRAEWRLLGDRLQTCDITKPFYLRRLDNEIQQFDIITAWEVLEHIAEADLPQLFENIRNHLTDDGYFVGSIANWDDIDPVSGVNWHVTVHPYEWWAEKFNNAGFKICTEDFAVIDLARGGYNPPHCYEQPYPEVDLERSLYIAVHR